MLLIMSCVFDLQTCLPPLIIHISIENFATIIMRFYKRPSLSLQKLHTLIIFASMLRHQFTLSISDKRLSNVHLRWHNWQSLSDRMLLASRILQKIRNANCFCNMKFAYVLFTAYVLLIRY